MYMIKVCPLKEPSIFVQRGKLHETEKQAEIERKEWAKVYNFSKVVKCRPMDIKMYDSN